MAENREDKIAELGQILAESRETLKEINEHKKEAAKKFESIKKFCTDSENLLGIEFHDHQISNYKKRAKSLHKELLVWAGVKLVSLALATVAAFLVYRSQASLPLNLIDPDQWSHYIFILPLAYSVYLSSKNYEKVRDLLEKYEYKTATVNTLKSHIHLLREAFPEEKERILKFTLEKMNLICREPYNDKKTKRTLFFKLKNIFNSEVEEIESSNPFSELKSSEVPNLKLAEVKVMEKQEKSPVQTP